MPLRFISAWFCRKHRPSARHEGEYRHRMGTRPRRSRRVFFLLIFSPAADRPPKNLSTSFLLLPHSCLSRLRFSLIRLVTQPVPKPNNETRHLAQTAQKRSTTIRGRLKTDLSHTPHLAVKVRRKSGNVPLDRVMQPNPEARRAFGRPREGWAYCAK